MERMQVNGVELPYRDEGAGRPIVVIHGGGPDMDTLRGVAAELASDHRVITYNRRGFWGAGAPASSWEEHRDDLAALLDNLDVDRVAVVGSSAGGIVALDLAVNRPDLVEALVLHEPAIYGRRHMTVGLVRAFVGLQWRRRTGPADRAMVPFLRWIMRHRDGVSVWDRPDYSDERKQLSLRNAQAVLTDLDNGDGSHIAEARLREIRCPVTLVMGEKSQPWFHKIARTLTAALPASTVIEVPGVGHAMTFEDPAATAAAIRTALQAVPQGEPTG